MAKRIVWTSRAESVFTEILDYYCAKHKSKSFSRKLNRDIYQSTQLLSKYPLLGLKSDFENIRVLVRGHHKIFYEVGPREIIIHLVWDTRQNPSKLTL